MSLIRAAEYADYLDLQAKSSTGLESSPRKAPRCQPMAKPELGFLNDLKTPEDKKGSLKAGLVEMVTVKIYLTAKSLAQEHGFVLLRSTGSLRGRCQFLSVSSSSSSTP